MTPLAGTSGQQLSPVEEPALDSPSGRGRTEVTHGKLDDTTTSSWGKLTRMERIMACTAAALLLVLRWFYARSLPWNSDEPQHLHVVWAWATGLLPYRDVFDNHTPLFHLLSVPLFRLLGERADIVLPMRLAMIPLFAMSLWCTYRVGAQVFSPRAGLWSALLLGFYPKYFFMMGQYRTDVLWTVLWVGALVVLTGGVLTKRRLFFAGLLVGAAFAVSMKTALLLLTMIAAGVVTWIAYWRFAPRKTDASPASIGILSSTTAALAGLLLIPSLIVSFFAMKGALDPLYYCVIQHNILPDKNGWLHELRRFYSRESLTLLPALALAATSRAFFVADPRRTSRQLFVILLAGFYCPLLRGFWRTITSQDYVPWYPLLALVVAPAILLIAAVVTLRWPRWGVWLALPLLLLLAGGELRWILRRSIFGEGSPDRIATIAQTLRLTEPGEYVMDPKGDLIFRPRPYYYVLETLTHRRLKYGLMKDELSERLIETRTAVVETSSSRMTEKSLDFVHRNYLRVGYLDVLGKMISTYQDGAALFEVTIPERYIITAKQGRVAGTLDGQPLDGARWLAAGPHELRLTSPASEVAVVWARALERGFSPFDVPPKGIDDGN